MTGKSYGERHADWSYCDNWGQVDVLVAEAIAAYRERLKNAINTADHAYLCADRDISDPDTWDECCLDAHEATLARVLALINDEQV